MGDEQEKDDPPAAGQHSRAEHVPYGVLRRYYLEQELGGDYPRDLIEQHLEECTACSKRFDFILDSSRMLQARASAQWDHWQQVLRETAALRQIEDREHRAHVAKALQVQGRLKEAQEEPDEAKRDQRENEILQSVNNPCFIEAAWLVREKKLVELAELSERIRHEPNDERRILQSQAVAEACKTEKVPEASLDLLNSSSEVTYEGSDKDTEFGAIVKVFSLEWIHSRADLSVVSIWRGPGVRIVINAAAYRKLFQEHRRIHAPNRFGGSRCRLRTK